ncbi:site-specific integrase [Pseudoflavonifractor capillosus]|uniref:tyrosine-type recombinase/integrase n=1 Tax=Pseudoflavonifractor capillosus TaxID=106588 RepID=UPI001959B392|nr:site-specific integrase [Pseudoflavonifractor capillosus]MBM6896028.1 site-specific integrase [Pseudoflavonifractor capillosus]
MAKKKERIPQYGTITLKGIPYYRTRILDADGKQVSLYALSCEELYQKEQETRRQVEEILFRRKHPTVAEYCEKWLLMQSAKVSPATMKGYTSHMNNYIVKPLGKMYLEDVTADDIRLALIPLMSKSAGLYSTVNMLIKCVFYSAERNQLLDENPCVGISAKGGKQGKKKDALTDEQVKVLLDTTRGLPPYTFIMIALHSGLRREEILGLQWDCVFLDVPTPYISVRRAWRSEHNRPVVSTTLKTKASRRDIPIPGCLVDCLRKVKETTISEYVIADRTGQPLSNSQFQRVWKYVTVRSTKPHSYYKYVNGQCIKTTVTPTPGGHQKNNPGLVYAIDFDVTPHQLRHTYITNLLYAGVDPKTVQYLAGHENSKTTMDIYAKVKYNKPEELCSVVNGAFRQPRSE